jgi:2-amino-4-hydroxy-6-hydroxymethyldihydropteridine diphosphokinase
MIFIGIGSNLGDRLENIRKALYFFEKKNITLVSVSSIYETPPWGFTEQPPFLNALALVSANLSPYALLSRLLEIETLLGRERRNKWGPRVIDLDILCYRRIRLEETTLKLPHPHFHERAFVLAPWKELAPNFRVFEKGPTISDYYNALPVEELAAIKVFVNCTLKKSPDKNLETLI